MNRKAKTITKNGGYTKSGKKISKENLYKLYSIRGAFAEKGNFLRTCLASGQKVIQCDIID